MKATVPRPFVHLREIPNLQSTIYNLLAVLRQAERVARVVAKGRLNAIGLFLGRRGEIDPFGRKLGIRRATIVGVKHADTQRALFEQRPEMASGSFIEHAWLDCEQYK